jgi:hypothetical protein
LPTLIDTHIVNSPVTLVDPERPEGSVVHCRRIMICSEDGEAEWCRMDAVAGSAAWPPTATVPSDPSDGRQVELTLGLGADQLPLLDGPVDAADLARDLLAGNQPDLSKVTNWYLLVATPAGGEPAATAWATQPMLGLGPPPTPVSPLLARVLAVMFEEGWEPRRSAAEPSEIVSAIESEEGWVLSATAVEETGEVLVALTLPDDSELPAGATGPGDSALATVEVDDDGVARVCARVQTVDGSLPAITVGGMIDAVIDAAREWSSTA